MTPGAVVVAMEDIVEAALAAAEDAEAVAEPGEDGGSVDVSEFGPVRVGVVGAGERGRTRLSTVAALAADWNAAGADVRTGLAPVEAPEVAPLRPHPGGHPTPELAEVDLLVATGHVHSRADLARLRAVAGRATGDCVTVAVPTIPADACDSAAAAVATGLAAFDAVVPLATDRVAGTPPLAGPGDADPVDRAATEVALALVEPTVVGAHRPVTPHVPVVALLADGGVGRAHVGEVDRGASPADLVGAALDGPLSAPAPEEPARVVARLDAGSELSLSFADGVVDAVDGAVLGPTVEGGLRYVGAACETGRGATHRAVVVTLSGE
jgi:hypothetical protein